MTKAYRETKGDLASRMLAALDAAQSVGGDIRGKQSAAILIVTGKSTGKPWTDRLVDLHVEDHPEPLKELRRLVQLRRAYRHMDDGDLAAERNDIESALKSYAAAIQLNPESLETKYWAAVSLANADRLDEALPLSGAVFTKEANWRELTTRLRKSGWLKVNDDALKRILAVTPGTEKSN